MDRQTLLAQLPPEWPADLLPEIQQQVRGSAAALVVLDDDPTGTQTVHDLPVLTEWTVDALAAELASGSPVFYVLTNSRSLPLAEAVCLAQELGRNLWQASQQAGRPVAVVSRSDSTLRGHFPGEVQALAEALQVQMDGILLVPAFFEGGRYTVGDVHYVADGERLTPAGETEFARDHAFGYTASDLKEWVQEKTGGGTPASQVASVSIEDLRRGGPERVAEKLSSLAGGRVCAVNAASYRDLQVFVHGLLQAEAAGKRFLYRTAASFVQVRAGLAPRSLVTAPELDLPEGAGGLVVVGSYVPKSTAQLADLRSGGGFEEIELPVADLLAPEKAASIIRQAVEQADRALGAGRDVLVWTSRALVTGAGAEASLQVGRQVSQAVVALVKGLQVRPRYLVAKGGITSSDIATRGLGVRKAQVVGQILPGVPVWRLGPESRFPGLAYIVFPGNVGGPDALSRIVSGLSQT